MCIHMCMYISIRKYLLTYTYLLWPAVWAFGADMGERQWEQLSSRQADIGWRQSGPAEAGVRERRAMRLVLPLDLFVLVRMRGCA